MQVAQILSLLGAGFSALAMVMTRMIPLRVMVIIGNFFYICYGVLARDWLMLAFYACLLPLNYYRLRQMQGLVSRVERASSGTINMDWLSAFMTRRATPEGEIIFHKGDAAHEMYYIASGRYRLPEIGVDLATGAIVGEIGLMASERGRTASLQCVEKGELLVVTYDEFNQLYFQNPEFGYHFLQLITKRLLGNLDRALAENATMKARAAGES